MAEQSVKILQTLKVINKQKKRINNLNKTVKLIIKRQDNNESKPYEETFEIPYKEKFKCYRLFNGNRRNPVNAKGEKQHQ